MVYLELSCSGFLYISTYRPTPTGSLLLAITFKLYGLFLSDFETVENTFCCQPFFFYFTLHAIFLIYYQKTKQKLNKTRTTICYHQNSAARGNNFPCLHKYTSGFIRYYLLNNFNLFIFIVSMFL